MPSNREVFWQLSKFAVVGHTAKKPFPRLTYRGLKNLGKTVFPVDPSTSAIDGDSTYADLASLPEPVDGVVLEIPREECRDWVAKAAEAGIKDLWMHQSADTPEALALAKEKGINTRHGTCAVMYVTPGLTYHAIHRGIMKLIGKY
jgi:predicted CoA-binding protein